LLGTKLNSPTRADVTAVALATPENTLNSSAPETAKLVSCCARRGRIEEDEVDGIWGFISHYYRGPQSASCARATYEVAAAGFAKDRRISLSRCLTRCAVP
jgi:hypothetical protein